MFAFCLCLVFNAHPDAWLTESEFVLKYASHYARAVLSIAENLDHVNKHLRTAKDDEQKADLTRERDRVAKQLQNMVTDFNKWRTVARMTALADSRRFIFMYLTRRR